MLGEKAVYGSRLQYFIKSGDIEVGCMQFSASSWALEAREKWIGWTVDDKKVRLNLIVNNSRYLIFPWVHIKNLASKALSLAAEQLQGDWLREYCYAPVLLETFVDLAHFKGTVLASSFSNTYKTSVICSSLPQCFIPMHAIDRSWQSHMNGQKTALSLTNYAQNF
ncbi:MAG: DUF4338 domain-containing protein [Vallitaleaceae bacterium]|nr:DUF4338 domain-containing protein [Vallitaleaceae bacterium]